MVRKALVALIEVYQRHIRVLLPHACRFTPSCSEYMKQGILKYGFYRGVFLGVKRILRCHPFAQRCGYDPLL